VYRARRAAEFQIEVKRLGRLGRLERRAEETIDIVYTGVDAKGLHPSPAKLAVSTGSRAAKSQVRLRGPDGSDLRRRRCGSLGQPSECRATFAQGIVTLRSDKRLHSEISDCKHRFTASTPVYNDIDRFLGARLEAARRPNPLTSDLEFLRRVSLDTTGLIPRRPRFAPTSPIRRRAPLAPIERLLGSSSGPTIGSAYWQMCSPKIHASSSPISNNTGPFRWCCTIVHR